MVLLLRPEGLFGRVFKGPVSDEAGIGGNPEVVVVRHGPPTPGGQAAIDLKRTSSLR